MKTILLADPDCGTGSVADALQRDGYGCIREASARAALDVLRRGAHIDLAITETLFSDMDGLDFLSTAKRTAPNVPIIVVTSLCTVERYLLALNLGAAEFVHKPVSMPLLFRIVHSILGPARPCGFPFKEAPSKRAAHAKCR